MKNTTKKKILFLTKFKYKGSRITQPTLYNYIKNQGHDIYHVHPNEVNIILNKDNASIFYDGIDISKMDIVISRNSKGVVEKVDQIIKILKSKGAVVFGHEEETPFSYRKFGNHFKLLNYFPKTIYFSKNNKEGALKLLKEANIEAPFILKPEDGSRGVGIALIKNREDFEKYFNNEEIHNFSDFIIQEYLDVLNEYRVFVLGKESLGVCEKIGNGLVAKNFAQGGKFIYLRDKEIESLAEELSKKLNHHTLGFDVIRTKNGELKILEVNSWANFTGFADASNINMAEKIFNYYLDFAAKHKDKYNF